MFQSFPGYFTRPFQRQSNFNWQNNRGSFNTKKRSGCKLKKDHTTKDGVFKEAVIFGWKYTKRDGLVKFVATPAANKYQKNPKYTTFVAKITSNFGQRLVWCFWNPEKKCLNFPDLKMTASPNGDYWAFIKPKR